MSGNKKELIAAVCAAADQMAGHRRLGDVEEARQNVLLSIAATPNGPAFTPSKGTCRMYAAGAMWRSLAMGRRTEGRRRRNETIGYRMSAEHRASMDPESAAGSVIQFDRMLDVRSAVEALPADQKEAVLRVFFLNEPLSGNLPKGHQLRLLQKALATLATKLASYREQPRLAEAYCC